jgi:hypothetical protein
MELRVRYRLYLLSVIAKKEEALTPGRASSGMRCQRKISCRYPEYGSHGKSCLPAK